MHRRVVVIAVLAATCVTACSADGDSKPRRDPSDGPTGAPATPAPEVVVPDNLVTTAPAADFTTIVEKGFRGSALPVGEGGYLLQLERATGDVVTVVDAAHETRWRTKLRHAEVPVYLVDDLVVLVDQPEVDDTPNPGGHVVVVRDVATSEVRWRTRGFDRATAVGRQVVVTRCASYDAPATACTVRALAVETGRALWARDVGGFAVVERPSPFAGPLEAADSGVLTVTRPGDDERSVVDLRTGRTLGRTWTDEVRPTASGYVVLGPRVPRGDGCRWDVRGLDPRGRVAWHRTLVLGADCDGDLDAEGREQLVLQKQGADLLIDAATGVDTARAQPEHALLAGTADVVVEVKDLEVSGRSVETCEELWTVPMRLDRLVVIDGWGWNDRFGVRVRLDDGLIEAFDDDETYEPLTAEGYLYNGAARNAFRIGAVGPGFASGSGYVWGVG